MIQKMRHVIKIRYDKKKIRELWNRASTILAREADVHLQNIFVFGKHIILGGIVCADFGIIFLCRGCVSGKNSHKHCVHPLTLQESPYGAYVLL